MKSHCVSLLIWLIRNKGATYFDKLQSDCLTNDDDQDPGHNLENQGEGDERQDCNVVSEEEEEEEERVLPYSSTRHVKMM